MNFKDCDNESLSHGQIKFQRIIIFWELNIDKNLVFFSFSAMYIEKQIHRKKNAQTIYSFLFYKIDRSNENIDDDERSCIHRGVNFVFFFFFFSLSLFLTADKTSRILPSMCYFLLTVGWRSCFFSRLSFLSTTVRQPWPVAAKRERKRSEPCHCSFFSILSERTTTKEMSGWWMNIIPSSFSCSIWRSVQTHCRVIKQKKKRKTICDFFSLLHPSFSMIKDKKIMSQI